MEENQKKKMRAKSGILVEFDFKASSRALFHEFGIDPKKKHEMLRISPIDMNVFLKMEYFRRERAKTERDTVGKIFIPFGMPRIVPTASGYRFILM